MQHFFLRSLTKIDFSITGLQECNNQEPSKKSKWAFFANFPAWKECDSGRENGVREEDFVHFKDPKKKQGLDTQSCNLRHIFYSEALVLDVGENPPSMH